MLVCALAIREQQLGETHPDTVSSLDILVKLYIDQKKYAEAEPLSQRVLKIHEQQLGLEHPDTVLRLKTLAIIYLSQGKCEQAEPLFQQALAIDTKTFGADPTQRLASKL